MIRALAAVGVLTLAAGVPAAAPPAGLAPAAVRAPSLAGVPMVVVAYSAPVIVPLHVLRAFAPPVVLYGPGHRGVDLDVGSSRTVLAAAAGVVSFAGPVAGRGVVVIAHPDGVRTEYEPVRPLVRSGTSVRAGQVIGTVSGTHPGCPSPMCLHWGARRGTVYVDPLSLLRPLGPVRLLPWVAGTAGSAPP